MKKILFIIVVLLSVSTWSMAKSVVPTEYEVKPTNKNLSPEQVKCKLEFKRCSNTITITIDLSSQEDCGNAQNIANQISIIYASLACD